MGWFGIYGNFTKMSQIKEAIKKEMTATYPSGDRVVTHTVEEISNHFGRAFVLSRYKVVKGHDVLSDFKYISVVLWRKSKDELMYKELDETCGPFEVRGCPLKYLKMADEPRNEYAKQFRDNVLEWHKERRKK